MDKFLELTTNALSQDQPAHATKQLTHPLTNARTAQLDNLVSTKVHANQLHSDVTEMVEFNWPSNNAINAKTAQLDKYLEVMYALSQDQHADASNS